MRVGVREVPDGVRGAGARHEDRRGQAAAEVQGRVGRGRHCVQFGTVCLVRRGPERPEIGDLRVGRRRLDPRGVLPRVDHHLHRSGGEVEEAGAALNVDDRVFGTIEGAAVSAGQHHLIRPVGRHCARENVWRHPTGVGGVEVCVAREREGMPRPRGVHETGGIGVDRDYRDGALRDPGQALRAGVVGVDDREHQLEGDLVQQGRISGLSHPPAVGAGVEDFEPPAVHGGGLHAVCGPGVVVERGPVAATVGGQEQAAGRPGVAIGAEQDHRRALVQRADVPGLAEDGVGGELGVLRSGLCSERVGGGIVVVVDVAVVEGLGHVGGVEIIAGAQAVARIVGAADQIRVLRLLDQGVRRHPRLAGKPRPRILPGAPVVHRAHHAVLVVVPGRARVPHGEPHHRNPLVGRLDRLHRIDAVGGRTPAREEAVHLRTERRRVGIPVGEAEVPHGRPHVAIRGDGGVEGDDRLRRLVRGEVDVGPEGEEHVALGLGVRVPGWLRRFVVGPIVGEAIDAPGLVAVDGRSHPYRRATHDLPVPVQVGGRARGVTGGEGVGTTVEVHLQPTA